MKTFATVLPLHSRRFGAASEKKITGAAVASSDFLRHLVLHGGFEEYLFYPPAGAEREATRQALEELGADARADVRAPDRMAADLARGGWDAFWAAPSLGEHLRRLSGRSFPTVWMNHGPIHQVVSTQAVLDVLRAPRPFDAILGTSRDHVSTLRAIYAATARRMGGALGVEFPVRCRFERVPLGVDLERFRPLDRLDARRECGLPADRFVVLVVGRMVVSDKMDLLPVLEGLRQLVSSRPDDLGRRFLLVLRGEQWWTDYGAVVRREVGRLGLGEHVRFEPDAPLPALYAAADVFLGPSDGATENFGLTPVEAMACGTPAVVSDWNGYRDTVVHGETGFRFRTCGARCDGRISALWPVQERTESALYTAQSTALDVDEMLGQLVRLHDDPALREQLGQAARRHVERHFAWPVVIERFLALVRELHLEARRDASPAIPAPEASRVEPRLAPSELGRSLAAGRGALLPGRGGPRRVGGPELAGLLSAFEGGVRASDAPAGVPVDVLVALGLLEPVRHESIEVA